MTTTLPPADRQAFIRALRDDPVFREEARALLLTQEVLELPEKLAQLTERVDRFIAAHESFNAEQRQVNAKVDRFIADQEVFNAEQRQFNAEQRQVNQRVEARLSNMDDFIAEQRQINQNVDQFIAEQRQFNRQATVLLGQVKGDGLEAKLERSIGPILARTFNLHAVQTLQSRYTMPNQEFNRRLAQAQTDGKITPDQALQLSRADYILYARRADTDAELYFVIEVSWTLGHDDIVRARERADIMAAASGVPTQAVAIAQEIPPAQADQAATAAVTLIHDDGN